jgi:hypothetical protein
MAVGVGLLTELYHPNCSSNLKHPKCRWMDGVAAAILAVSLLTGLPANADEFNVLAVYSEARPINDRWQACAASYVRPRLQSKVSSGVLAGRALRSCRPHEGRLRLFFLSKIGRRSAENVVAALRFRYKADLAVAIEAARTRD